MPESAKTDCIYCDIINCAYNDDRCHCLAPSIEIRTMTNQCTANCSEETVCSTFRPKTPYKTGYQGF